MISFNLFLSLLLFNLLNASSANKCSFHSVTKKNIIELLSNNHLEITGSHGIQKDIHENFSYYFNKQNENPQQVCENCYKFMNFYNKILTALQRSNIEKISLNNTSSLMKNHVEVLKEIGGNNVIGFNYVFGGVQKSFLLLIFNNNLYRAELVKINNLNDKYELKDFEPLHDNIFEKDGVFIKYTIDRNNLCISISFDDLKRTTPGNYL